MNLYKSHLEGLYIICCIILLSACKPSPQKQLNAIIEANANWNKLNDSLNKGKWPDFSEPLLKERKDKLSGWIQALDQIDNDRLAEGDRINYDMLKLVMENDLANLEYGSHMMPLNSEGGFIVGILYAVQGASLQSAEDIETFIQKLKTLPAYLKRQQGYMDQGLTAGKSAPKLIAERSLSIVETYANTPAKESMFVKALKEKGSQEQQQQVLELVQNEIIPAYQGFAQYLEETYIPSTRSSIGASELTNGAAYYDQRVKFFTTLDITAEEVFETGMEEVSRIRAEMEAIVKDLEFEGSFEDFLTFLRTDPQFYAQTPDQLLHHAAWLSKKIEGKLPQYFGKLPRMPFTVKPVPASIAPNYTGGRYSEGSYTNKKPGAYWVNTYRLETRPLYVLPSLTLHEAVPGHHLQIMLAAELENVPAFRRNTYLSAFGEGWALYAEYLGKEAGMYATPYEDFGRLTYEMWRACRLVVDVGMHAKGWTRKEAVDFMAGNTALSMHEVNTEIDRYIGWPAQALSYKMGEITIRQLRKEGEATLGEKFNLAAFHDLVLKNGSIPMESLRTIVRNSFTNKEI